jgi:hypothetical protein
LTTWSMARLMRSRYVDVVATWRRSEIRKIWQALRLLAGTMPALMFVIDAG